MPPITPPKRCQAPFFKSSTAADYMQLLVIMENNVSHGFNLLVIADDLTGALDTGVQFAKGTDVEVYLSLDDAVRASPQARIRVINTDTRHAPAEEARKAVMAAVNAFQDCTHFYKKTDSCLRGNIGAEFEALMEATGTSLLPFVPAYPALKRTTCGGFQCLDGELLHKSPMANDPLNPIIDSFIPSIIANQFKIPVCLVGTDLTGTDPRGTDLAGTDPESGTDLILVFDGETTAHLEAAAKALWERGLLRVSAGCAGFAEALMETLPLTPQTPDFMHGDEGRNVFMPGDRLPILVITGSLNPVSIGQVEAVRGKYVPCFGVTEEDLLEAGWFYSESARFLAADCRRSLQARGLCVLGTDLAIGACAIGSPPMGTDHSRHTARQVAAGLGKITQSIVNESGPLHLVVFGGDTLLGIMKTLGYKCLRPLKEVFPGVVLASTESKKGWLVTKSGAFGDRGLILEIEGFLRK
jgi:uncharacterized protein YgbK (DUF1537 family)